jgi:hypothetical protein
MPERPEIRLGQWIAIDQIRAVVSTIHEQSQEVGDCEVVFNSQKPTNRDAEWRDGAWRFVDSPDFGGYAESSDRLRRFVAILKAGY